MPKSTKHKDGVKSLEEFRAPWETESGEQTEIKPDQLKRYIHNLLVDKAVAQDAREDALARVTEVETERDEFKTQAEAANGDEAQKKIDALQSKLDKAQGKLDEIDAAAKAAELRAEVLGDFDTTHPKAAKYVVGSTKEELEASLTQVREDFGIESGGEGDEEDEENDPATNSLSTRPRGTTLRNGSDPKGGARGEPEIDFDKIAESIVGGGRVFG